jgi:hypothetical protein
MIDRCAEVQEGTNSGDNLDLGSAIGSIHAIKPPTFPPGSFKEEKR